MDTSKKMKEEMREETMKKGWKSIVSSLFIILLFLLGQVLIGILTNVVFSVKVIAQAGAEVATQEYILEQMMESGIVTVALLVATVLTALIACVWYKKGYVKELTGEEKSEWRSSLRNGKTILSLVLTGIGCYSLNLCICILIQLVSPNAMNQFTQMSSVAFSGSALLSLISTVLIAPIGEEILFRGIILQRIAKNNKIIVAIIAQAVLFGVYHANLVQGLYVIPMGIALGYIAYRFHSVLPCILVHMVNNAMPNFVQLLPENVLGNDMIMGIIFLVALLGSVGIIILLNRKDIQK